MRRIEREISEFSKIIDFVDSCDVVRVGMQDEKHPYVVPLSFGYEANEEKLTVYVHGAKEGKKVSLIEANGDVCVEFDAFFGYKETAHGVTAAYTSVMGYGKMTVIDGDEAVKGLNLLMKHCKIDGYSAENCMLLGRTNVYKIELSNLTAKSSL